MPTYTYRCATCQRTKDAVSRVDDRHTNAPSCGSRRCGGRQMALIVCPPQVVPDLNPYYCVVSEGVISSRKQRREMMKRYGVVEAGDVSRRERDRRREREERIRAG